MRRLWHWLALFTAALLIIFNLRRLVFTLVALLGKSPPASAPPPAALRLPPAALILVPCRNEAATLPGLIESLARLNYPVDRLRVALIDDGSTDASGAIIDRAVHTRSSWAAIHLQPNRGKPQAMNEALAHIAFGDIVVVYDVDHRPEPESLTKLLAAFDNPRVAGASGQTRPINPAASWPAYYATVESLVHQMITMRAKDRLDLAPALLGSNCAYRRRALAEVGGFRVGALLEDSDLTLALTRLGYHLRFVPESIAWHQVPETATGYLQQHLRWARGFNDVAREHTLDTLRDGRLPRRVRAELALFSLGYFDRLALLAAVGMRVFDRIFGPAFRFPLPVLQIALAMPFIQIATLFSAERVARSMWRRFPVIPILFGLDILVAVRALFDALLNRPRMWTKTRRISEVPR